MSEVKSSFDVLSELLINQFGVDPDIIGLDVPVNELGLDSLTLMEFIFAAEDAFSLRIPEEKLNPHEAGLTLATVCSAIDTLRTR